PAAIEREGGLADTSCYARQGDEPLVRAFLSESGEAGLAARLAARFVEASKLSGQIAQGLDALQASRDGDHAVASDHTLSGAGGRRSGSACTEAARGRLEHRIALRDGLVTDYAIAAPTSSHFGDGGIAARSLSALSARTREELAAQADFLIRTIDPCVGYEVRFH
ncbi:MAG: nickel-dependent hydrogenase large subunit, partial [Devosia sp.]